MRRLIPFALTLSIFAVFGGSASVVASAAKTSPSSVKMVLSCSTKYGVKPTKYVLACGDYNTELTNLKWTDWGDPSAFATGQLRYNDCTPNCASGTWKSVAVTVWTWDIKKNNYTELSSNQPKFLKTVALTKYPN